MKSTYTQNGTKANLIVCLTDEQADQLEAVVKLLAPVYGVRSKSLVVRKALSAYLPKALAAAQKGEI